MNTPPRFNDIYVYVLSLLISIIVYFPGLWLIVKGCLFNADKFKCYLGNALLWPAFTVDWLFKVTFDSKTEDFLGDTPTFIFFLLIHFLGYLGLSFVIRYFFRRFRKRKISN